MTSTTAPNIPYSLAEQKTAIDAAEQVYHKHILIWGQPKSGKTHLLATAVKSPYIDRVYWFDNERGLETLLYARTTQGEPLLTQEEMAKIIPFNIQDTFEEPRAAETFLRTFRPGSSAPTVCIAHGIVDCPKCSVDMKVPFTVKACEDRDLVVVDTLSQLADSVLAVTMGQNTYKDLRKYYGDFTLDMLPILTAAQSANTNIICATHTIDETKQVKDPMTKQTFEKILGTYPLCGSKNFSKNKLAKHFNYSLYTYTQGREHKITGDIGVVSKVEQVVCRRHVSLTDEQGQPTLLNIFDPQAKEVLVQESSGPAVKF